MRSMFLLPSLISHFPIMPTQLLYNPSTSPSIPSQFTQLKVSQYILTHSHFTHPMMYSPPSPSYPNWFHPIPIHSNLFLCHPPYPIPVNPLNTLYPTLSFSPQNHPISFHSTTHLNPFQFILSIPSQTTLDPTQLIPSYLTSIHLTLSYYSNPTPLYSITFPPHSSPTWPEFSLWFIQGYNHSSCYMKPHEKAKGSCPPLKI